MTKETALIILALIIVALPVICVFAWAVDMSDRNLNILVAIQTVIFVGWAIHCKTPQNQMQQKLKQRGGLERMREVSCERNMDAWDRILPDFF